MKRVMIVGQPGSGKSTLARQLGERTGIPVHHMDMIHWKSGWIERAAAEKSALTHQVHQLDTWIFEGGHSATFAERVRRADTFIWLDFPIVLRVYRVLRRVLVYRGESRPDLPDGCPERLDASIFEFLGFIWRTRHTARARMLKIAESKPVHLTIVKLTNRHEVAAYLDSV